MDEVKFLESYDDALNLFESVKPWRGSQDRPWGDRKHSTKRMVMLPDRSIAFQYQGFRFAIWHPDGTLTVEGFGSAQQKAVWDLNMPESILFDEHKRTGSTLMVVRRDMIRDSKWWWGRFPKWISKSGLEKPSWGDRKANPDVVVIKINRPVRLHYCAERDIWWPVDEDALEPFEWAEIDKKRTRAINIEYKLTDFDGYLKTLTALVDNAMPPWGGDIDDEELLEIIKSGDFPKAMEHFPRGIGDSWQTRWKISQNPQYLDTQPPRYSHFSKLRTQLYKDANALIERSEKILTLPQLLKVRGLLYRFE